LPVDVLLVYPYLPFLLLLLQSLLLLLGLRNLDAFNDFEFLEAVFKRGTRSITDSGFRAVCVVSSITALVHEQ